MYQPPKDLVERLLDPSVTTDDVYEYLEGQEDELNRDHEGPPAPEVGRFFQESDLEEYRKAQAWWPRHPDLPHALAFPTLFVLCHSYHEQDPRIGATFNDRLRIAADKVAVWITEKGLNLSNPNETADERKSRLNRDKQSRHRIRTSGQTDKVSMAYKTYLEACKRRKAAYDLATIEVDAAHAAWQLAKVSP